MDKHDFRQRKKLFALRVIKLVSALPRDRFGEVIGRQLLKSGTSIGANYREALRASSRKHFVSIIEISLREANKTLYWLELLMESRLIKKDLLLPIAKECDELVAIFTATGRSTKLGKS